MEAADKAAGLDEDRIKALGEESRKFFENLTSITNRLNNIFSITFGQAIPKINTALEGLIAGLDKVAEFFRDNPGFGIPASVVAALASIGLLKVGLRSLGWLMRSILPKAAASAAAAAAPAAAAAAAPAAAAAGGAIAKAVGQALAIGKLATPLGAAATVLLDATEVGDAQLQSTEEFIKRGREQQRQQGINPDRAAPAKALEGLEFTAPIPGPGASADEVIGRGGGPRASRVAYGGDDQGVNYAQALVAMLGDWLKGGAQFAPVVALAEKSIDHIATLILGRGGAEGGGVGAGAGASGGGGGAGGGWRWAAVVLGGGGGIGRAVAVGLAASGTGCRQQRRRRGWRCPARQSPGSLVRAANQAIEVD